MVCVEPVDIEQQLLPYSLHGSLLVRASQLFHLCNMIALLPGAPCTTALYVPFARRFNTRSAGTRMLSTTLP